MSELDFAAEILPKSTKILAVTGTNGKSTVVTFAGQVLEFSLLIYMYVTAKRSNQNPYAAYLYFFFLGKKKPLLCHSLNDN